MKAKHLHRPVAQARGITLVEILLVVALLIIIAAFALPSAGTASARAEMNAAVENLAYSIDTARNVARLTESSVNLSITPSTDDLTHVISFSGSDHSGQRLPGMQEYRLPDAIELTASRDRFVFDRRGLVDQPGRIMLVSRVDDSIVADLPID